MTRKSAPPRAAALAVVVAASLWGTTGTVAHFLGGVIPPLVIGAATMGVGGAILLTLGGFRAAALLTLPQTAPWVWAGGVGVLVYPLAFYQGMHLAGVAVGNIVALGSGPIVVALIEWIVDRRRPGWGWTAATALAVTGIVLLATADLGATSAKPGGLVPGIGLALLAGVSYALFSFAMGHIMATGHSPRSTLGAVFGAGGIPLLLLLGVWGIPDEATPGALSLLGYLILGPMVVSYLFFARGLRLLTSSSVLTIALVEPAVATALAMTVVGERFDLAGAVGLALIVIAVIFAARGATTRKEPSGTYP
jgi:drug/metabolite transporter, DME family